MKQQQNNMNQSVRPHSPTYQHQQLFSKNNRLYQQLLQEDLVGEDKCTPNKFISAQPAHIKFNQSISSPIKLSRQPGYILEQDDFSPKLPKSGLFKVFEPSVGSVGRISNHATQSLSSNYCITEHQNEENSTINLYSLTRNHIEPDISHNITAKINEYDCLGSDQQTIKNDNENKILQPSILNNSQNNHESSQLQYQRIKKYRSEEYSHKFQISEQNEDENRMPKVLVQKYLKNDLTHKFSISQHSDRDSQSNFKTVLNEIHVVPYKINNQIKPYTFSVPIQNKLYPCSYNRTQNQSDARRTTKANSLNLKNSQRSIQQNEEQITKNPPQHLYFSNHAHAHLKTQFRSITNFEKNQSDLKGRQTPKSQPKYNHNPNKNNRSNSIESKNKPNISAREIHNQHEIKILQPHKQNLQQSHVTKIFKNYSQPEDSLTNQQSSVIYESTGINICCTLTSENKKTYSQANKINFMMKPKQDSKLKQETAASPFFYSSIDMTKVSPFSNPNSKYKINPIQMIRQLNEGQQSRGIKLVGFPRKDNKY